MNYEFAYEQLNDIRSEVELQETYIGLAIATVAVLHSCTTDHAMFYVS